VVVDEDTLEGNVKMFVDDNDDGNETGNDNGTLERSVEMLLMQMHLNRMFEVGGCRCSWRIVIEEDARV